MAKLYSFILVLDRDRVVREVRWNDPDLHKRYAAAWCKVVGQRWEALVANLCADPQTQPPAQEGTLTYQGVPFTYRTEEFEVFSLCFLSPKYDRGDYLEAALDLLNQGVQVYDRDGRVIYFDAASKALVGTDEVEGRYLLDLFELTDEESTVLTALRDRAPVLNRFVQYRSKFGRELITVNRAYPISLDGEFLGLMDIEEDITQLDKRAAQLEEVQQAMRKTIAAPELFCRPAGYTFQDLIGSHPRMRRLKELARRVAAQDSNVMIIGETGTGKEILAQSIHRASPRHDKPFVALNCAAVPESLIESALFGTAKGSFTGSMERPGLFEEADGGTLFLDELNSMSQAMQSKVLRVLQEGVFRRAGGNRDLHTDVRVLASSNENAMGMLENQSLRSDLFYRLATIILELPPLRERTEDIEELVRVRIRQNADKYVFPFTSIEPETLTRLRQYPWPGNVRELFNAVDYAMNVANDPVFRPQYLPSYCVEQNRDPEKRQAAPQYTGTLQAQVGQFEAEAIEAAMNACGGNVSRAAKMLGLPRQGLQYRIRKYGIWS